jgi:hypothetical protein
MVRDDAIDLFRHATVKAPQPGFYMSDSQL